MTIVTSIYIGILLILCITVSIVLGIYAYRKEREFIKELKVNQERAENNYQEISRSFARTNQSYSDVLSKMAKDLSNTQSAMSNFQLNIQNIIDEKLKIQSEEFKKDLNRVNTKVDTILGMVMECDNDSCPTKKRVSEYLKKSNNSNS